MANAALSAALFFACDGSESPAPASLDDAGVVSFDADAPARHICDGTADIRLAFGFIPERVPYYEELLTELGTDWLYVDGQCNYWVTQPSSMQDEYRHWRAPRQGVLTPAREAALNAAVGYSDARTGPGCVATGVIDGGIARLWDGERVRICLGALNVPVDWPLRAELHALGAPVAGPLRIRLRRVPATQRPTYDWPLAVPPERYAVDPEDATSFVVDDPMDVEALRELRETVLAAAVEAPSLFPGVILIAPTEELVLEGQRFVLGLAMREELPFTGPDGLWRPPDAASSAAW